VLALARVCHNRTVAPLEHFGLNSVLCVHRGASKMWYGVAAQDAADFKQACLQCKHLKSAKQLHDLSLQVPPKWLRCA
jgi:hypothetical protein